MTPAEIRFATDGMLQSLGTWLRLLGYDCIGDRAHWGWALVEQAAAEDRVFLTRNAHLNDNLPHELLQRSHILYVLAEHLPDQLHEVTGKFALDCERFLFTRCVVCNELLRMVPRDQAQGHVPDDVLATAVDFWRCAQCQKTYWRGSHVRNSIEHLQH